MLSAPTCGAVHGVKPQQQVAEAGARNENAPNREPRYRCLLTCRAVHDVKAQQQVAEAGAGPAAARHAVRQQLQHKPRAHIAVRVSSGRRLGVVSAVIVVVRRQEGAGGGKRVVQAGGKAIDQLVRGGACAAMQQQRQSRQKGGPLAACIRCPRSWSCRHCPKP